MGLLQAKNELIARMDADDISAANRFEVQIAAFNDDPELALLGGQITEFGSKEGADFTPGRKLPTKYVDILRFVRHRSPFNHPTMMYKKEALQDIGGYPTQLLRVEDYAMVMELVARKYKMANLLDEVLFYRIDSLNLKRQKKSTMSKLRLHAGFLRKGYVGLGDFLVTAARLIVFWVIPLSFWRANRIRRSRKVV
jgi:hypothetical protein